MILFALCVLIAFTPTGRALFLSGFSALLAFALLPVVWAWIVVALGAVVAGASALDELRARRAWLEDDETIRRAKVRWARRYLDP